LEDWEFFLRKAIFSDFLRDRHRDAQEKMSELIIRKNGGKLYRYRPLDDAEVELISNGNIYFCRAVRFEGAGDVVMRFRSYLSCFTDDLKSEAMWYKYADQSAGMCLEYNFEDMQKFAEKNNLVLLPVIYDDEEHEELGGTVGNVLSMMTKSTDTSGESEWRLWKYDKMSSDIGKILSGVHPRKIHIGEMADLDSGVCKKLSRICEEKDIDIQIKERSLF
jgi:hypothetical protein